jgi:hypothetical protein
MSGESKNPDCNDRTLFFQNKATGNCLFESVAQIFYPISWDFDNMSPKDIKEYNDTVIQLANTFRRYVSEIYSNLYNIKSSIPTTSQYINILNVFGLKEIITLNNQKMTLLEYSEYIKKDGEWAADDDLLILGKLLKINYRILLHQQEINYIFDSNNNNSNIPTFTFCNLNDKHWVLHRHDHPLRHKDAFVEINKRFHELIWSKESPPPPPLAPPPPPPLAQQDNATKQDEEKSEDESLIKIVVIYIFVNQKLLIFINNDEDKQKAPVVPVGIFETSRDDKTTFKLTLEQAGLQMPENFNPLRRSEYDSKIKVNQKDIDRISLHYGKPAFKIKDDTIVSQKTYYLFIDNLPDGYYDITKPNSNKFVRYNTYPHYISSKLALALIPLTDICDVYKNNYKNDYFNKVCQEKEILRSKMLELQELEENQLPDNTTNQLSLMLLYSAPLVPASAPLVPASAPLVPASAPLISNEKDAIDKIDALQLLKKEQYSKQNKLKELKQDLASFELEKNTTLTQINSLEKILNNNNNGDLGLGTGPGTEMITNPSKREETTRKQQNQEDINDNEDNGIELTKKKDTIQKNSINEDNADNADNADNEDNGIELTKKKDTIEKNSMNKVELAEFKKKLETILKNRSR